MTINTSFSNHTDSNQFVMYPHDIGMVDDGPDIENWNKYPKEFISGNFKKSRISRKNHGIDKQTVLKLKDRIWGGSFGIFENSELFLLHQLWKDKARGRDYLRNSIKCAFSIQEKEWAESKPFRCIDLIESVASMSHQESKDFLIETLEGQTGYFATAIKQWVIGFSTFSGEKDQILNRLSIALQFLADHSPKLLHICYNTFIYLGDKVTDSIFEITVQGRTLATQLEALKKGTVEASSKEDEATVLRREVLRCLKLNLNSGFLVDEKILGMALGDSFIRGSSFNGANFQEIFSLFLLFEKELGEELTAELQQMRGWCHGSNDYIPQIIDAFAKRKRVAVPGGWQNPDGGHAMVIEALDNGDGTATVRLYNQGAGVRNHRKVTGSHRDHYDAYLEKSEIPVNLICSWGFWKVLLAMRNCLVYSKEPIHSDDLYNWFIHSIPGKIRDADTLILPQRSGTCTIKSILAFLKKQMNEEKYDSFILQFKFGILAHYEEGLCYRKKAICISQRRFLREIREKLLISVEVQRHSKCIDDQLANTLSRYCKCDVMLSEDREITAKVQQLSSTFDLLCIYRMQTEENQLINMHNGSIEVSCFQGIVPSDVFRHDVEDLISNAIEHSKVVRDLISASNKKSCVYAKNSLNQKLLAHIKQLPSVIALNLLRQIIELSKVVRNENSASDKKNCVYSKTRQYQKLLAHIKQLPSLSTLAKIDIFSEIDKASTEGIFRAISDLICSQNVESICNLPFYSGVPPQLVYAWLTEFVAVLMESIIWRETGDESFTISLAEGTHFLESKDSILLRREVLSPLGERLLSEFSERRSSTKGKESIIKLGSITFSNGKVGVGIAGNFDADCSLGKWLKQMFLDAGLKDQLISFEEQNQLLEFLLKFPVVVNRKYPNFSKEEFLLGYLSSFIYNQVKQSMGIEIGSLCIGPCLRQPNSAWFNGSEKIKDPVYKKQKNDSFEDIPPCLPHVGILQQLDVMEKDVFKVAEFKPEKSWLQCWLTNHLKANTPGIDISSAHESGASPLLLVLHSKIRSEFLNRLKVLAEKILNHEKSQGYLCNSMLELIAQTNVRLSSEDRIYLQLGKERQTRLKESLETSLYYARYLLSLPKDRVIDFDRLQAIYYLRMRNGSEQSVSFTAENTVFIDETDQLEIEKKLDVFGSANCWLSAEKLPGAQAGQYKVCQKKGVPVLNGIVQFKEEGNSDRLAKKIIGTISSSAEFGPWKIIMGNVLQEKVIGREWVDSNHLYHVIELKDGCLVNGPVMKRHLSSFGLKIPDIVHSSIASKDVYFEFEKSSSIGGLPSSFRHEGVQFWKSHRASGDLFGIIVDTINRRSYFLLRSCKNINNNRIKIYDPERGAYLLTAHFEPNTNTFVKWGPHTIAVPFLGNIGAGLNTEIWVRGSGKNMQMWLNCMDGNLRIKVTSGLKGKYVYESLDYEGYVWDREQWVPELGYLHGVLLSKGKEQILVLPRQEIFFDRNDPFRNTWTFNNADKPHVLYRKLHDDCCPEDSQQSLFTTSHKETYISIICELIFQRDYERAKQYVKLLPVNCGEVQSFQQIFSASFFRKLKLDHPKARVLRLAVIANALANVDDPTVLDKVGYPIHRLRKDYMTYIDQYPHLPDGWALTLEEEKRVAQLTNWLFDNRRINNHIQRIQNKQVSDVNSVLGVDLVKVGDHRFGNKKLVSGSGKNDLVGSSNYINWLSIYRPEESHKIWIDGLEKLLMQETDINRRVLQCAVLWFSCRNNMNRLSLIAKYIRRAIRETAAVDKNKTQIILSTGYVNSLLTPSEKNGDFPDPDELLQKLWEKDKLGFPATISSLAITQLPPALPLMIDDASSTSYTKRQKGRRIRLHKKVLDRYQTAQIVNRRLPDNTCHMQGRKRKLDFNHQIRRPSKLTSNTSGHYIARECFNEILPQDRSIKKSLAERLRNVKAEKKELLSKLKLLNISLPDLYEWLDSQSMELGRGPQGDLAENLVHYAQKCSEVIVLERTLKLIADGDREISEVQINRSLSCTSIENYPMEPHIRYRLAAFIWRRKIALRPGQLETAIRILKGKGSLTCVDCGGGKTAIISPLFFKLEKQPVFNIAPPGIIDQQTQKLSADFEMSEAVSVQRIELTRANVWSKLDELDFLLKRAKNSRTPIVATVADMSSIILSYFESTLGMNGFRNDSKVSMLQSIIKTMKTSCSILLDEVDTAAKEQIHWAIGKPYGISSEMKESLNTIFETLINSVPPSYFKGRMNEKHYSQVVLPKLIEELAHNGRFPEIPGWSDHLIIRYLSIHKGMKDQELTNALKKVDINSVPFKKLQWFRSLLTIILPHCLSMRYLVQYGPNEQGDMVVPYVAAQEPDPKCRFSHMEIIACLTLLWGINATPKEEQVFKLLRVTLGPRSRSSQLFAKMWLGPNAKVADLRKIQEKEKGWRQGIETLQGNLHLRLMIATMEYFPNITLHHQMLKFTVATLEHFMDRVVGLTATPFNKDGMDPRMIENFIPSKSLETTKTLLRECRVGKCPDSSEMKEYLKKVASRKGAHGLIDPNAILIDCLGENSSNEKISSLILQGARSSIKQVVYWDIGDSKRKVVDRQGLVSVYDINKHKNTESFFFFDQARSRGTDLPLPRHCHVDVLVDKECTFTELKQAGERCREAKSGTQKLNLLVPREWENNNFHLDGEAVIQKTEQNQLKQLGELLPIMAKRQIFEICRQKFFDELNCSSKKKAELKKQYWSLLVEKVDSDMMYKLASLSEPTTIEADLVAYKNSMISKYGDLLSKKEIDKIGLILENCLMALKNERGEECKPNLDLRIQSIQTIQSQQQLQSQVLLEQSGNCLQNLILWPADLILCSNKMNDFHDKTKDQVVIPPCKPVNTRFIPLAAMRASKFVGELKFLDTLWISQSMVSLALSKKAFYDSRVFSNWDQMKRKTWQYCYQGPYVLRVISKDQSQSPQHLLLTVPEADLTLKALRKLNLPYSLHSDDGKAVYPRSAEKLSDHIQCRIALINGNPEILPSDVNFGDLMNDEEITFWLSYLKRRLINIRSGDPRCFRNNALVKLLKCSR